MPENDRHKMVLVTKNPDGAEEWMCPTCGRRFLIQWPPKYKRTILEPGDESAAHVGGKGEMGLGLNMAQSEVHTDRQEDPIELTSIDDESLSPWKLWMDKVGFDDKWNSN
jgi:hypothetical protein